MTVIEFFSGIGSQTQALKNIGIEHEVIGISEIDKYAVRAYEQLHGEVHNFGDITKIESLPYCDLLTYSFPCQDLSIAGNQAGIVKGNRSGLLFEVERLLNGMIEKPKYLLLENVKNLISKKFYNSYQEWLNKLTAFGYVNYSMLLNAKDYGIPQNRERVFCVSIRKDVDNYFWTPEKIKKIKLDMFLLNKNDYIVDSLFHNRPERIYSNYSPTIKLNCNLLKIRNPEKKERLISSRECFRLMGFKDEQFDKIEGISDSQLYKLAGNSIVVNVLEAIFKNLFKDK
jgi:DNA-cytosine methyltransferase